MRPLTRFLTGLILPLVVLLPLSVPRAHAANPASANLIANPSVELATSSGDLPLNWNQGGWGDLTRDFKYLTSGAHQGSKALMLTVTNYVEGDAKWYFDPVLVDPQQTLVYEDYYITNTETALVAQFEAPDGTFSYQELGVVGPNTASAWQRAAFRLVTPNYHSKLTVFHLLRSNGYLKTDTFALYQATKPEVVKNVPNPSLSQVDDVDKSLPLSWNPAGWGTNTAKYTYNKNIFAANKSVRVDVTKYTDGDAKWAYDPQPIQPNQYYRFRDYYKSNLSTEVVATIELTNGETQYLYVGTVPASSTTTLYSAGFTTPAGAKTLTMYHLIAGVGYLVTERYSVTPMDGPFFNRPIVSLSFDDGWLTTYETAFPLLKTYGLTSTQYIVTSYLGTFGFMTGDQVKAMDQAGHEIGSHTVSHPDLTTSSNSGLGSELKQSQATLKTLLGKPVTSFAIPYGSYNKTVLAGIKQYYASARSSDLGFNTLNNLNPYNLRIQYVGASTTSAEVKGWIDEAIKTKSWLVILYHQINTSGSEYSTTPAQFEQNLQALQASGVSVQTVSQALQELLPQL